MERGQEERHGWQGTTCLIAGGGVVRSRPRLRCARWPETGCRSSCSRRARYWYRPLAVAEPFALGEVLDRVLEPDTRDGRVFLSRTARLGGRPAAPCLHVAGWCRALRNAPAGLRRQAHQCGARRAHVRETADGPTIEALLAELAAGSARRSRSSSRPEQCGACRRTSSR